MVDLADRAEREAALARRLGKANAEARRIFMAAIEDGRIDEDEWRAVASAYQSVLQAELEDTAFRAGMAAAEQVGIGIDPALLQARTIQWARTYSYDLVTRLDATNRALLQQTLGDYFSGAISRADLAARIDTNRAFGPVRAQMIAATETTRAISEGEQQNARELEALGLKPTLVINTAQDDRVCPICGPLSLKTVAEAGQTPPFHIGCRCFLTTEFRGAT